MVLHCFISIQTLLAFQHREYIMRSQLDYQDIAMYFDKLVRAHDVDRSAAARTNRLFT